MLSLAVNDFNVRVKTIMRLTISLEHDGPEEAADAFRAAAKTLAPNEPDDILSFAAEWVAMQFKKKGKRSKKKVGKRVAPDPARPFPMEVALDALYGNLSPEDTAVILGRHGIKVESRETEMSQLSV